MTFHAVRCPCGAAACRNWLVSPVANVQGVSFTQAQAETVAAILNLAEINGEKILMIEWLTDALAAMNRRDRGTAWRPIVTAPRSGFGNPRRFVLTRGPSGYTTTDKFVVLAYHDAEYRPHDPWRMLDNSALSDFGWVPEEWAEVPT